MIRTGFGTILSRDLPPRPRFGATATATCTASGSLSSYSLLATSRVCLPQLQNILSCLLRWPLANLTATGFQVPCNNCIAFSPPAPTARALTRYQTSAKPVIALEGSYIPEPLEALEQLAFLWSAPEALEQLTFLRSPLEG